MLLYVCLILLPAAALSQCGDDKAVWQFFGLLDENNDGKVLQTELKKLFEDFDKDKNGSVTLPEIKDRLPDSAPDLQGREQALLYYFDPKKGREISVDARDVAFRMCDTNNDQACSKKEYETLLVEICSPE